MLKGFKEFISQGNALELAVAVIIGAAFKPIVDAITKVIMTIIGQLIGSPNFDSLGAFSLYDNGSYTFHLATAEELAKNPDGYVMPGTIITTVINFFLVAAAVYFAIVMPMNTIKERDQGAYGQGEGRGGGQEGHRHRAPHRDPRPALRQAEGLIARYPHSRLNGRPCPEAESDPIPLPGTFMSAELTRLRIWTDFGAEPDRFRRGTGPISARNRTDLEPELNRSRRGDPALTTCDRCHRSCRHRRWRDHCAL